MAELSDLDADVRAGAHFWQGFYEAIRLVRAELRAGTLTDNGTPIVAAPMFQAVKDDCDRLGRALVAIRNEPHTLDHDTRAWVDQLLDAHDAAVDEHMGKEWGRG